MRAVELAWGILAPDHVLSHHHSVGLAGQRADRVLSHDFHTDCRARHHVQLAVVTVVRAAQADVLLFPDAMSAANDVVDEISIDRIEALEVLAPGPFFELLPHRPADRRQDGRVLVPGHQQYVCASTPTSSNSIHSSTIRPPAIRRWLIPIMKTGLPAGHSPRTPPGALRPSSSHRTATISPSASSLQQTCST